MTHLKGGYQAFTTADKYYRKLDTFFMLIDDYTNTPGTRLFFENENDTS